MYRHDSNLKSQPKNTKQVIRMASVITKIKLPVDHKTIPAHTQLLQLLLFVNRVCVKENMHEHLAGKNG
jgi:hypothetical protein